MTKFRWILSILTLALFAGALQPAQGQDITMMYTMTAKAGSEAGFEAALKSHMEFREANGDPWDWRFYQVVVGEKVGTYMARSGDHSWADFDTYIGSDFANVVDPHWGATIQPMLESSSNVVEQGNEALSRAPENTDAYTLYNVTVFYLKPDQQEAFMESVGEFRDVIIDADLPFYWVVNAPVAGADGPSMAIVGFAENWAALAEDPAMTAAMVDALGEDGLTELYEKFNGSYHYTESYIVQYRPDLSSGGM